MKVDCIVCHTTEGWGISNSKFEHSSTEFKLIGQHQDVNCISCHTTLRFNEAKIDCESCHTDIHENSVGFDCERCHSPESWVVPEIEDIHRMSRFPLLGGHKIADCSDCHESSSLLNFKPIGANCSDCHFDDYQATTKPNHIASNYSINCDECHSISSVTWYGAGIVHAFFPLTGGHDVADCYQCHQQDTFVGLSQDCSSCHINDYNSTVNPSHITLGFSTDCQSCHTIDGWQPATFDHDDRFFPIYSGEHSGEWDECSDCHTNQNNYAEFSCIGCHDHNQSEMDSEHSGVDGYVYDSYACFACHPTGHDDGSFSHTQKFPLAGSHSNITCSDCHVTSYTNISADCNACHQSSYDNSQNPNHKTLVLSEQCEQCHDLTEWTQTTFNHTTTGFELLGSHTSVDCADCHAVNVTNAVPECFSCHENEYTNALDHLAQSFPKECEMCHNSVTWIETTFDHNATNFPLTGAHITSNCSDCHSAGYSNISTECSSCHQTDFDNSTNPSHQTLGLSIECAVCHTTNPGWVPAEFPEHNNYFELLGAHAAIASNCVDCHNNDYNNTPTDCVGCHEADYNNTTNPSHSALQFSTTCDDCHSVNAWAPATFDHDGIYFPIYSGEHKDEWNECSDCHTTQNNYAQFSCIDCHEHNQTEMDSEHKDIAGYVYESIACFDCHPTGDDANRGILKFKIEREY
ncbi:MAG: hypothetical protein L3J41_05725 [Melioribacteraceae bacterium]|nr:hypothetical protein [Melioribacteraceae bacterium]